MDILSKKRTSRWLLAFWILMILVVANYFIIEHQIKRNIAFSNLMNRSVDFNHILKKAELLSLQLIQADSEREKIYYRGKLIQSIDQIGDMNRRLNGLLSSYSDPLLQRDGPQFNQKINRYINHLTRLTSMPDQAILLAEPPMRNILVSPDLGLAYSRLDRIIEFARNEDSRHLVMLQNVNLATLGGSLIGLLSIVWFIFRPLMSRLIRERENLNASNRKLEQNMKDLEVSRMDAVRMMEHYKEARAEAEKARDESARLAAIVETSVDAIIGKTQGGTITSWNRAAERLFGYREEEMIGKTMAKLVPPDRRNEEQELLQRLNDGQPIAQFETIRIHKDGKYLDVSLTLSPIKDSHGKVVSVSTIARDITQRKRLEQEIRQQKDRAQLYLDVVEVMLLVLNERGEVTLINKKGAKILGYDERDIIGKEWFSTFLPEAVQTEVRDVFHRLLMGETKAHEYYENIILTKYGERLIAWHNSVIRNEFGTIIGVLSSGLDITERKKAEEAMLYSAAIVDSSDDAIISQTLEGVITSWNKGAEAIYGYTADEMIGKSSRLLIPDEKQQEFEQLFRMLEENRKIQHYQTLRRCKDGRNINVSLTISPITNSSGITIGASTIARDMTEHIRAEESLKRLNDKLGFEKRKLEQVLSFEEGLDKIVNMNKLIDFVVEKTSEVLDAERCSLMLFDETTQELFLKGYRGIPEDQLNTNIVKLGEGISGFVAQQGQAVLVTNIEEDSRFLKPNGLAYTSKSFMSAPIEIDGGLIGLINVANKNGEEDVFSELDFKVLCMIVRQVAVAIESAKLYRELKHLTVTDPTTNMYNYRHFAKSLDHELRKLKRYSGSLTILMIDVDNFKAYNDRHGHMEGDILLKQIGRVLKENLRDVDIACRYAGDEFVVILPETRIRDAQTVARKIKQKAEETISTKQRVTLSIGVVQYTENMNRYDLIRKADRALFKAKNEGKDLICVLDKSATLENAANIQQSPPEQ